MTRARRSTGRHRWVAPVVLLVVVWTGVGPVGAAVAAAPAAPAEWDPRIAPMVTAVERLRGLEFARPVPVKVLDDDAFERRLLGDREPTRKARRTWDETQDAFLAMGLLDERIPFDDARQAGGTNVAGFYDPKRRAIVVRGSTFDDPSTRTTLVHELTHALQDQHFGIEQLQKRASKADSMLTQALIEGDATEVEQRYFAQLSQGEQDAAATSIEEAISEATPLPPFLEALFYAPYLMGAQAVRTLRAVGGQDELDGVMRRPPTRDLGLIDPTALSGPPDWKKVATPALDDGDVARGDPFPMDAVGIYLVLAEHLGWSEALHLAERWGGDRAITFTRAGRPCVRMRIEGRDGARDAAALADGFTRWAARGGTETDVAQDGSAVDITLCDPPEATGTEPTAPAQALVGITTRNGIFAELVESSLPARVAKCAADEMVGLPALDAAVRSVQSVDDQPSEEEAAAIQRELGANATAIIARCRRAA